MLHGWMDVSATFQFLVDALAREWRVLAPDWRGFGLSQWNNDAYWFPDYIADLDALASHYSPEAPLRLLGHSMGGNAASLYAGVCPERVLCLAALEGFGLGTSYPGAPPEHYSRWLSELCAVQAGKRYPDRAAFALRLRRANHRLSQEQADFLSLHLGEDRNGGIELAADPHHHLRSPVPYCLDDVKACWRMVTAPVLWVTGRDSPIMQRFFGADRQDELRSRIACFADIRVETVANAGHNVHHDQPQSVARLLEAFVP